MATVTSKNKAKHDEEFMEKRSGKSKEAADLDVKLTKWKNQQRAEKAEKHWSEKPMASEGLKSYRYQGRYGHIMIGAKDHEDALKEAQRSTRDKVGAEHLEEWNEEHGKYAPLQKQ
ncbi:hypothetical protein UFOVP96_56 [uncultured Caudovirales phage]|uniref:Uncharacterized protein n=1 Tax=uncultured Caudovirales phage TaxID=2100421 RepID=A0A6J5L3V2_9CAUD|nr:hypothetical protein UFOVP96_56 [uncultured Caudovirales phage]